MAKDKASFSKLSQMRAEERARAAHRDPGLLNGLTPTELALLFPDYYKRIMPDAGGFYAAISKTTAERQSAATQEQNKKISWLENMRQQYGATTATGNLKANQQEAYKAARAEGLSDSAARILVANMSGESLRNPADHHWDRSHMSQGIVQWDPGRAERIRSQFGAYPKDMSVAQQTKAAIWEMKNYYKPSWQALNDDSMPAQARMNTVVSDYERPQDVAGSVATRMQFHNGLNINDESSATPTGGKQQVETPQGKKGDTTPSQAAGDTTGQAGKKSGAAFNVVSGYVVPKDSSLYDTRNAQQCATLGKAFNPSIGRSSGWTVVDSDIKAGQVVATKQYNNSGSDKVGAGYHTGVALTAPNEKGDFLLLEQYNNSGGAKTRWVNKNSYPIGDTGKTTSWGLISSNGKVHGEISSEALSYGQSLGTPSQNAAIGSNAGAPGAGGEAAPGVAGEVYQGPMGGSTFGQGDQQSATLMQPMGMVQNLMGMMQNGPMGMMGMMGGMGGQSATPLGLITTAMGFIMPLIGSIAGERLSGEGMGDAGSLRSRHRGHVRVHSGMQHAFRGQSTAGSHANRATVHAPNTHAGPKPARSVNPVNAAADPKHDYMRRVAIEREAKKLGVDPHHLTTAMLYESIGSLNPNRMGVVDRRKEAKSAVAKGAQNRFMGLIQFGAAEQHKYGVKPGMSFDEHMSSVGEFLKDRGLAKWMKDHPNATEEQKKIALYSTINAGSPDEKNWHKTDKRYGGSATTIIQKTQHMFRDWGGRASTLMASNERPTQFAQAMPTTGEVTPGPTTTPGTTAITPQHLAAHEQSMSEKIATALGAAPKATAGASPVTTTPTSREAPATPPNIAPGTPSVSSSISAATAPKTAVPRDVRNPLGMYSTPSSRDMMYQFGGAGKTRMSADLVPQTNVPAATAAPITPQATVAPLPGAQNAPGPAPDTTAMQMNQMRNEVQAVMATNTTNAPASVRQVSEAPSKGVNLDNTMKQIAQPYDNPSFHRAITRAYGNETPGEVGQNHFSYGNAR